MHAHARVCDQLWEGLLLPWPPPPDGSTLKRARDAKGKAWTHMGPALFFMPWPRQSTPQAKVHAHGRWDVAVALPWHPQAMTLFDNEMRKLNT